MEIRVVAVSAAAVSSLLNLSHLSNPLEQSQLVAELLNGFPQARSKHTHRARTRRMNEPKKEDETYGNSAENHPG